MVGEDEKQISRQNRNDTHYPFRLYIVIGDEKKGVGGGGGGGSARNNQRTISYDTFRFSKLHDKLKLVFTARFFFPPSVYFKSKITMFSMEKKKKTKLLSLAF